METPFKISGVYARLINPKNEKKPKATRMFFDLPSERIDFYYEVIQFIFDIVKDKYGVRVLISNQEILSVVDALDQRKGTLGLSNEFLNIEFNDRQCTFGDENIRYVGKFFRENSFQLNTKKKDNEEVWNVFRFIPYK